MHTYTIRRSLSMSSPAGRNACDSCSLRRVLLWTPRDEEAVMTDKGPIFRIGSCFERVNLGEKF
jgi:hypothetical protein